jgi:hypothetical protein
MTDFEYARAFILLLIIACSFLWLMNKTYFSKLKYDEILSEAQQKVKLKDVLISLVAFFSVTFISTAIVKLTRPTVQIIGLYTLFSSLFLFAFALIYMVMRGFKNSFF